MPDQPRRDLIDDAHRRGPDEVLAELSVDLEAGLSRAEAEERAGRYGRNAIIRSQKRSSFKILLDQFSSAVVLLLLAAAVVSALLGKFVESVAIAAALVLNAAIGFAMELRASRSVQALRAMGRPHTRVRRGGEEVVVESASLVPGDIVLLAEGDVVPADVRLLQTENLECDESTLTGESMPVAKSPEATGEAPLAERTSMAYRGTTVTRGAAEGAVVAIGMDTELGQIATMVEGAEESSTPLEKRLAALTRRLLWLVLFLGVAIAVAGVAAGKDPRLMIETAIILAIAAVPEGLAIVSTVALARGMWRMAARNALVNRLSSVETLGATSVILSDKTGTLTENRMSVTRVVQPERRLNVRRDNGAARFEADGQTADYDERLRALVRWGALCTNTIRDEDHVRGEPMEVALVELARALGRDRSQLLEELPERREEAFSPETKMMATFHEAGGGVEVAVKGATEAVLQACSTVAAEGERALDEAERARWLEHNEQLASEGLRVLAIAHKRAASVDEAPYEGLELLGLVGFRDPPRPGVAEALDACRSAGVQVVLVTGDHAATARSIAEEIGIAEDELEEHAVLTGDEVDAALDRGVDPFKYRILARVSPRQKLAVVEAFQKKNAVLGMTGDGVNDAPALKRADIGIAMGRRGTDAAREASDIVLRDDAFETIVAAIEQGRNIFENIRRFIVFLLSGNLGELLAVGVAALANAPLPLLPLQILFINLLLDVFPALALGVSPGSREVMRRPPRPAGEPVLTRRHWTLIGVYGVLVAASVLAVYAVALRWLGFSVSSAVSVSFLAFGYARLLHVFNMRDSRAHPLINEVSRNPWVWAAIVGCASLLAASPYVPGLNRLLDVEPLGATGWGLIAIGAVVPLILGQIVLAVDAALAKRRRR